jgi:hypothetical protein
VGVGHIEQDKYLVITLGSMDLDYRRISLDDVRDVTGQELNDQDRQDILEAASRCCHKDENELTMVTGDSFERPETTQFEGHYKIRRGTVGKNYFDIDLHTAHNQDIIYNLDDYCPPDSSTIRGSVNAWNMLDWCGDDRDTEGPSNSKEYERYQLVTNLPMQEPTTDIVRWEEGPVDPGDPWPVDSDQIKRPDQSYRFTEDRDDEEVELSDVGKCVVPNPWVPLEKLNVHLM